MLGPTKEYQPLLPSSEDEAQICSGDWRRRFMIESKNRSTSKMRGAAYVMRLWPDHLSSTLYNCWVSLFVMVLMFTAMFGVLMTCSTIPNKQHRFDRELAKVEAKSYLHLEKIKPTTVYCPVIKSDNFNLSKHITSFAYLRERFPKYKYNVIVLVDNTNETTDKDNNVVAMNTVLNRELNKNRNILAKEIERLISGTHNLAIRVQLLADFFNDSPLKKNWKKISKTLVPFLIQPVAIWQTGGIALDLNSLVEKNSNRFKKAIEKVLIDFPKVDQANHSYKKVNNSRRFAIINVNPKVYDISRKPINNIRDVINRLQNNDSPAVMQANLMGEASKIVGKTSHKTKRSLSVANSSKIFIDKEKERHELPTSNHTSTLNTSKTPHKYKTEIKKHISNLPKILKILFNAGHLNANKRNLNTSTTTTKNMDHKVLAKKTGINMMTQERESVPSNDIHSNKQNVNITSFGVDDSKNKNVGLKENVNKESIMKKFLENNLSVHSIRKNVIPQVKPAYEKNARLFLDMKGELIATKVPCHAFIGHVFTTVQKYPAINSITKLIDKTLKTFCVVPSNCIGIRILF